MAFLDLTPGLIFTNIFQIKTFLMIFIINVTLANGLFSLLTAVILFSEFIKFQKDSEPLCGVCLVQCLVQSAGYAEGARVSLH